MNKTARDECRANAHTISKLERQIEHAEAVLNNRHTFYVIRTTAASSEQHRANDTQIPSAWIRPLLRAHIADLRAELEAL